MCLLAKTARVQHWSLPMQVQGVNPLALVVLTNAIHESAQAVKLVPGQKRVTQVNGMRAGAMRSKTGTW